MQAFKYKLYKTKRTKHIDDMLREAAFTWNKALAMQKRYYSLYENTLIGVTYRSGLTNDIKDIILVVKFVKR